MNEEELQKYTQRELAKMATKLRIKGAHDMKKAEVVNAIVKANASSISSKASNSSAEVKMHYVETAEIGSIVAFRCEDGKVKSAKIEKRSTKNRKLKLVTQYGAEFIVPFESIIWVRTGSRWPRGVFELLKGTVKSNEKTN
jgi:hypothetical protein